MRREERLVPPAEDLPPRGESLTQPEDIPRRGLLLRALLALQAAAASVIAIPAIRFLLTPLSAKSAQGEWVRLCSSAEVPAGAPVAMKYRRMSQESYRDAIETGLVWLSRKDGQLLALSAVCTHLGCAVTWDARREALACPCHGGLFSAQGKVLAGPPPRPLAKLVVKEEGGAVFIRPPEPA